MKTETYSNKLNELLGIPTEVVEKVKEKKKKVEAKRQGKIVGIAEENIQDFRAAQGIIYFLQAPELFQAKTCKHCGDKFIVSRMHVGYCSYTCIQGSLRELGIEWKGGSDMEAIIDELVLGNNRQVGIYEGNEPIWILKPEQLEKCLKVLHQIVSSEDGTQNPSSEVDQDISPSNLLPKRAPS